MIWSFPQKKIFGSLGESVCEETFGLLGYDVDRTGIEHKAPLLAANLQKTMQAANQSYGKDVIDYVRTTPDFLVSRVNDRNKTEAMYVEAKFKYCRDRTELLMAQESLRTKLSEYMKFHPTTLIFLVTNPIQESDLEDGKTNMIWLLSSKNRNNWVTAQRSVKYPIYNGLNHETLASVVSKHIDPLLNTVFKSQQR